MALHLEEADSVQGEVVQTLSWVQLPMDQRRDLCADVHSGAATVFARTLGTEVHRYKGRYHTALPTLSATFSMQLYRAQGFQKIYGLILEDTCTSPNTDNIISRKRRADKEQLSWETHRLYFLLFHIV